MSDTEKAEHCPRDGRFMRSTPYLDQGSNEMVLFRCTCGYRRAEGY